MTPRTNVVSFNVGRACVRCGRRGAASNKFCIECGLAAMQEFEPPPFTYGNKDQQFARAVEAEQIGKDLIANHYEFLNDLEIRVEYVFLKNTPLKNNKQIWGKAKKVSGLSAWLAHPERRENPTPQAFFVLEFSFEVWVRITPAQRVALVDHELCHCTTNDKLKPLVRGHDCEEFVSIVKTHGFWVDDVKLLLKAAQEVEDNPLFSELINESTASDFAESEDTDLPEDSDEFLNN